MIARLRGEVIEVSAGRVVVDVAGVGYEVSVPESVLIQIGFEGHRVDLYIRQVLREDDSSLYGFLNADQRRLFDLLRDVKGCGAKISLSLLSTLGEQGVTGAILAQDMRQLTRAPGVGPRLAERIVVELRDKAAEAAMASRALAAVAPANGRSGTGDELVDALLNLGYRRGEAEAAAEGARTEAEGVEDQIRAALRRLSR